MRFYEEYNRAHDAPVNAIAYELSNGGDLVRGKLHTWEAFHSHVWQKVKSYEDLKHLSETEVRRRLDHWLKVNEEKRS